MKLITEHLKLIPCDTAILKSAIQGNDVLADTLDVTVQDDWTEFGIEALQYSLDRLTESEEERNWWTYFAIHRRDNKLIGSGGYKGKPTEEGTVEIGYEIARDYRHQGLATEMAKGLIDNAFRDERVQSILAHTLGEDNPSTRVLQKCGFEKLVDIHDPVEGLIWKWELKRISTSDRGQVRK